MDWSESTDEYLKGVYKGGRLTPPTACFDLDHTLVVPKSGRRFPKNRNDWRWWCKTVPLKLINLVRDGYRIVLVTNQSGLKTEDKRDDWKQKVRMIASKLGVPMVVFAVLGSNRYRKPLPTLWEQIKTDHRSFYCGDAAGREGRVRIIDGKAIRFKSDFSDTDMTFALNGDVNFVTPDQLFLGYEPLYQLPEPLPLPKFVEQPVLPYPTHQKLIMLVGLPASGKSTISNRLVAESGFPVVRVNRDTLGTDARCLKLTRRILDQGKVPVIDNTNPTVKSREKYLKLADEYGVPTECWKISTPLEQCWRQNWMRTYLTGQPMVPKVAYHCYRKKYQEPADDEFDTHISILPPVRLNGYHQFHLPSFG